MAKLRVGLIYGGRSVEHEVSVTSATSILSALDPARYEVTMVAVSQSGRWHLGTAGMLPEAVVRGEEVTLPAIPGERTLVSVEDGKPAARLDVVLPIIHGTGGEDGSLQGFLELAGVLILSRQVRRLPHVGLGRSLRTGIDRFHIRPIDPLRFRLRLAPLRSGFRLGMDSGRQYGDRAASHSDQENEEFSSHLGTPRIARCQ